jgi:hypothetical protein
MSLLIFHDVLTALFVSLNVSIRSGLTGQAHGQSHSPLCNTSLSLTPSSTSYQVSASRFGPESRFLLRFETSTRRSKKNTLHLRFLPMGESNVIISISLETNQLGLLQFFDFPRSIWCTFTQYLPHSQTSHCWIAFRKRLGNFHGQTSRSRRQVRR